AEALRQAHDWVSFAEADACVVLGGDGFLLHVLHSMIDHEQVKPCYGLNLGTVGFMLNRNSSSRPIAERVNRAREVEVSPLAMDAITQDGQHHRFHAINEVSLLRETRQTAKLEVAVNGKVPAVGDTVDVATATYQNTIGAPSLATVWTDPEFDPKVRAFYYVRVLQIPTPTWMDYDMVKFKLTLPAEIPLKQQERAYTSAIWYNPA
ncbi:MAG TPA: DUF3604 domain-containing protein, partial [Novosphingobium sp.]|nr:DUF3604 domain-containing protein [Novosphingobium sp.]